MIPAVRKRLAPKEELPFRKLKNTIARYRQRPAELENREGIALEEMHTFDKAVLKIEHAALPGTIVKIGDRYGSIREEAIGLKSISSTEDQIGIL